ncbi:MAG: sigma-70 family RNA polymerase sigma factor [Clostridia bacterium]|nr:sigma-70 family RNA polymerase sigma factor [Clostridia bacterium]
MDFEALVKAHGETALKYIRFRLPANADFEDVYQETLMAAYRNFDLLKSEAAAKAWLIQIAKNKCADWFRRRMKMLDIALDDAPESVLSCGRAGRTTAEAVRDALDALKDEDQKILYLSYFKCLPQGDIAKRLNVPVGTVKSRLHMAKARFREAYPIKMMEETDMKTKLFETLSKYRITKLDDAPFACKWEELMGWMIVPREGETLSWGLYDQPGGKRTEYTEMKVVGKCEIHGIEGVEIKAVQHDAENYYRTGSINKIERTFFAQLTDTHSRYLAESHVENGVRKMFTFLDGDSFLNNWGYGEDNIGNETNLQRKGVLHRKGNVVTGGSGNVTMDVVGRYEVEIAGKKFDTILVMDVETFNDAVASESYIDKNGRTVLWRRFNRNDWALKRYGKPWTEMLPENERIIINGETYVHWYDCVSDYILR